MGVEDVGRREAKRLGLELTDASPQVLPFNGGLSESTAGMSGEISAAFAQATGGTVAGGRIVAAVDSRSVAQALGMTGVKIDRYITVPQAQALI